MSALSDRIDENRRVALAATRRIIAAMVAGKLPDTMRVEFTGWAQVILHSRREDGGTSTETLAALERMFRVKPTQESTGWFAQVAAGRRSKMEEAHVTFELNEPFVYYTSKIEPARIEVWDFRVPHVCRRPVGAVEGDRVVWRCGISGCKRVVPADLVRGLA